MSQFGGGAIQGFVLVVYAQVLCHGVSYTPVEAGARVRYGLGSNFSTTSSLAILVVDVGWAMLTTFFAVVSGMYEIIAALAMSIS